jgi:glycosyltransferase involved in cell wall biosynthesis
MTDQQPDYSVIIPVFNGEHTIGTLYDEVSKLFASISATYEMIFVFDCGNENAWKKILELKNEFPSFVKGIRLSRNYGQHNATICGITHARGSFIITIDEDLQHVPSEIKKLIDRQKESGACVVYGKYKELGHSSFRNVTSRLAGYLLQKSIPNLNPDFTSFRLIKRQTALEITKMNNSYTFLDGYITWITNNVVSVTVEHNNREIGKSAYNLSKLIKHTSNIFFTFSYVPIRLVSILSLLFFCFSTTYVIYILLRKLIYNDFVHGFPTVIIFSGLGISAILFGISVLGEYMYRVNQKTTQKPNFIVQDII